MKIPKGTFCVWVNQHFVPIKESLGFGDFFRNQEFRKLVAKAKTGHNRGIFMFRDRQFKVQL